MTAKFKQGAVVRFNPPAQEQANLDEQYLPLMGEQGTVVHSYMHLVYTHVRFTGHTLTDPITGEDTDVWPVWNKHLEVVR